MRSNLLIGVLVGALAALVSTSLTFDAYFAVADGWLLASPTPARTLEARVASLEAWRKGVVTKGLVTPMITAPEIRIPYKKLPSGLTAWDGPLPATLFADHVDLGHYHGLSSNGSDLLCYCKYPPAPGHSHININGTGMILGCKCSDPTAIRASFVDTLSAPPVGYHYHHSYFTGKRLVGACNCSYPPTHMHTSLSGILAPCNCTEALK